MRNKSGAMKFWVSCIFVLSLLVHTNIVSGETVITYWTPENRPAAAEAQSNWARDFEKTHTGVKVNIVVIPWAELATKIQLAFKTNTLPDVMYVVQFGGLHPVPYYWQGIVQPVSDVVKKIGEDQFGEYEKRSLKIDNEWVAVPWFHTPHILFFRKDWFDEKGLKPPKNWEEWYAAAKKLTEKERYGMLGYFKFPSEQMMGNILGANDAHFFDGNLNVVINNHNTWEALDFLKKLIKETAQPGAVTSIEEDVRVAFAGGLGAMMLTSTSYMYVLMSKAPELVPKVDAVPMPRNKGNRGGLDILSCIAVTKTTKNPDLAKAFVSSLYEKENHLKYWTTTVQGWIPCLKATLNDERFMSSPRIKPLASLYRAGVEGAKTGQMIFEDNGPNKYAGFLAGRGFLSQAAQRLLLEDWDGRKAAAWMEGQTKDIIKDHCCPK